MNVLKKHLCCTAFLLFPDCPRKGWLQTSPLPALEVCLTLTAHLQDGQKGARGRKTDRPITTCGRSITTWTQEFWHGRRKGKGFYATLVMLQEKSQELSRLHSLWNRGSRKKKLDLGFLTVPKLLKSMVYLPFYCIFCDWVIDSARTSFYMLGFFIRSHLTAKNKW